MELSTLIVALTNSVAWGCILALISLGLTLIYGQLEIINVAHGAMYTIGAVSAYYVTAFLGSWFLAIVVGPLVMGAIALGIYYSSLRFRIVGYPIAVTLIISYGFMFILEQVLLLVYGGSPKMIASPIPYQIEFLGASYPLYRLVAAGFSVAAIGALLLFLEKTRLGLWIRATNQDHDTASAMGVPVPKVYVLTYVIGTMMAALSGVIVAPMTSITHNMGHEILIAAFIIVIVGGFGSIRGTILAALIYSIVNGMFSTFIDPVLSKGVTLCVMIGILLWKPEGLLKQ
jgi:branched-chain amino acid transport system permease protein